MARIFPSYLALFRSGELAKRIKTAEKMADPCHLCPRRCGARRLVGERGICGAGSGAVVAAALPHFGEEPPITGRGGAGTIFFSHCALKCIYCQNYQISHIGLGRIVSTDELARMMLRLQEKGCENIDLVSPTPYLPWILEAVRKAATSGLKLPLVYNTHGYESPQALRLLDGVVDIYLPDYKYGDRRVAMEFSKAEEYPDVVIEAIMEMERQVGNLTIEDGIARRGIIVRHLVLPGLIASSKLVLEKLAEHLGTSIWISIMAQYQPVYMAVGHPVIGRRISQREYEEILGVAEQLGFENCFIQELDSGECYLPDFSLEDPFSSCGVPDSGRRASDR